MNVPFNAVAFNTPLGAARLPGVDIERLSILICDPRHTAINVLGRTSVNQCIRRRRADIDLTSRLLATDIPRHPTAIHISRDELSMEE